MATAATPSMLSKLFTNFKAYHAKHPIIVSYCIMCTVSGIFTLRLLYLGDPRLQFVSKYKTTYIVNGKSVNQDIFVREIGFQVEVSMPHDYEWKDDREVNTQRTYWVLDIGTVHVSAFEYQTFTLYRFANIPELEACGRLLCCVQRLCGSGNRVDEGEPRQPVRGRRGAQDLEGPSGPEDGILPVPVSPSPASTSSQEDSCKPPPRNCYRLVVLGSARVGKTAIVARFLSNKFEESYTPTIEDFHRKLYRIRGEVYQLDLLDTSGNHPFPAMRRLSFLTGDLFVLVFGMDSRESFEEAIRLREAILETKITATQSVKGRSKSHHSMKVPMVIVGNKCDRDVKAVTVEEAEQYCASQDDCCIFVEVSAKRNYHVDELFYQLFVVAGVPLEMAPNHHRKVPLTFGSPTMLPPSQPKHKATLSIKRRLSDACGVVAPNVRRPSIRTDLMIMRTKTCSLATGNENITPGSRITLRTSEPGKTCTIQ